MPSETGETKFALGITTLLFALKVIPTINHIDE
jgi:hypothetical protein